MPVCSLKSGPGAFPLIFCSIFSFPAPCCTQMYFLCCDSFHIASLAATGVLIAQTVLALRPRETSTTASALMKHIEQKCVKLFAKNRFVQVVLGYT